MPIFIIKFLENRNFRVRLGSTFSDDFDQEMGVPQGSILSVTLFSLKINSLAKVLSKDAEGSLYVDDFLMSYRSSNTRSCERQLQGCLKKIEEWCTENGFKFSSSKTVCVHFHKKRGTLPDPDLFLYGKKIHCISIWSILVRRHAVSQDSVSCLLLVTLNTVYYILCAEG